MLTIESCFKTRSLEESALTLISYVAYQPRKAYTRSVDGETFWDFGKRVTSRVRSLRRQLERQEFAFGVCRKITKKTKLNKVRDIYLSNWRDKLVERWLNECLCILLHKWFSRQSYAFRVEGVGLDSCIDGITKAVRSSQFFIKRDITQFFYTIDHDLLLATLKTIVDENDYLFRLLEQRIRYQYQIRDKKTGQNVTKTSTIGVPFGSSLAPVLANISLTELDKEVVRRHNVQYFRYSDDFLIAGADPDETLKAGRFLDESLASMKFGLKESHKQNVAFVDAPGFTQVKAFKHLGLEFHATGTVKLAVEKQRKIINFYKRSFKREKSRLRKGDLDNRLKLAVEVANNVIEMRIRSAAIVDYYLKHATDEIQLRNMDRIVIELLIGAVLGKKFRKKDFRAISPNRLRELGLISLVHRNKLHRHGHLKINFLSMYSDKIASRYDARMLSRKERVDYMRMSKKIRCEQEKEHGLQTGC
jgi:hypothetical protein